MRLERERISFPAVLIPSSGGRAPVLNLGFILTLLVGSRIVAYQTISFEIIPNLSASVNSIHTLFTDKYATVFAAQLKQNKIPAYAGFWLIHPAALQAPYAVPVCIRISLI